MGGENALSTDGFPLCRLYTVYKNNRTIFYIIFDSSQGIVRYWYDDILMTRKILVCMQLIMHGARAFKLGSEVSIVIGLASELTKLKLGGRGRIIFVPEKKRSGRNVRIL